MIGIEIPYQLVATRKIRIVVAACACAVLIAVLMVGAFPVALLRGVAERRLSSIYGAPVEIGALTRDSFFSFTPEITVHDACIGQPAWAGQGDFVKVARADARIPILSLMTGNFVLRSLHVSGLELNLVHDSKGNSNWAGPAGEEHGGTRQLMQLDELTIDNSRFSLRDDKRHLDISGKVTADASNGLSVDAAGKFDGRPVRITARGGRLTKGNPQADWPFTLNMVSDPLDLSVRATMPGALNFGNVSADVTARGTSLKKLDYLIEAGLFGTQEIDVTGKIRHIGKDWFIDTLGGTIGRSQISAKGSILKRDGRTKIDATIHSSRLDFDDLADDAGLAKARALEARIGKRVIPNTRIDLSKMGPTDGVIHFTLDRLLIDGGSAFRTFKGDLALDHRVLRLENAVVGLESGRLTGWVKVDSTRQAPILSTELRVEGSSLETMIGDPNLISGRLRGLVRITGSGTTIRDAFAHGNGKIAFVADQGSMNRAAAFVLGQDLGGALGQKLRDSDANVPLRCAVLAFKATGGVLKTDPLVIETQVSTGQGSGQIAMDGETLKIAIRGSSKGGATLKLVDPIRVGGTLSHPAITIDNRPPGEASKTGGVIRAIGRSIGNALGLGDHKNGGKAAPSPRSVNCRALAASSLR